jgi:hypothetical protein
MLNNLTNYFNIIVGRRIKTQLENSDLIAVGTKQSPALGDYKPTAITYSDLETQIKGYKSYTVSLQQNTIDPPIVLIEFENTLEVVATYTRVAQGEYLITFDKDIFTGPYQDYVTISQLPFVEPSSSTLYAVYGMPVFSNVVAITSYFNGVISDGVIGQMPPVASTNCILDIRVYNQ